jgi:hypothetical protein
MNTDHTSHRTSRSPGEGLGSAGFALPAAIFALVVVALVVTAGFYMAGQESRIGQSVERTAEARLLAEFGLNEAAAVWRPVDSGNLAVGQSATVGTGNQGDGQWTVRVRRVDNSMYVLESMGEITQGGRLAGATRTLFQVLRVPTIELNAPEAALTTRGNLVVGGNAQVDGNNSNGPANWTSAQTCPPADPNLTKPGVMLNEDGTAVRNNGQPVRTADQLGNNIEVAGAPPHVANSDSIVNSTMSVFDNSSWASMVAMADVRISRAAVTGYHREANGNLNPRIEPKLTSGGACDRGDPKNWGALENPTHACASYMPVIHLLGAPGAREFTIPSGSSGQGILLVDGDLHISGGFNWSGLILVRGTLRTTGGGGGDPQILGAVVSENSELDTQSVTGNSLIQFSACSIQRAIDLAQANAEPRPLSRRSWVDGTAAGF